MEDEFNQVEKLLNSLNDKVIQTSSNFNSKLNKIINTVNYQLPRQMIKIKKLQNLN